MTEDDDWFEAALRDDDDGDSTQSKESEEAEEPTVKADDEPETTSDESRKSPEAPTEKLTTGDELATDEEPATGDESTTDEQPEVTAGTTADTQSDGSLFDDDFASAFENAPGAGSESQPDFGDTGGFDGDGFDGGGGFGGGDSGFGDGGGFDSGGFEDEEFESNIPRTDIGIEGLDSMIQGGIPERTLMVAIGNAGTGKTTFGLQFLEHALSNGENAVYITLEESHERIINSATEKGWPYDEYVEDDRLAVVDLDPIEMANSLSSIRSELPGLIRDFGASRLVLDSVSLLEMMYEERAIRRNEIYDFTRSLKEAGVTTMLTSEASDENRYASRHGIIEYLTDAVFVLQYIRSTDDFRETRLAVEIQKIRDANHSREIKPYDITDEGISVYQQANLF